MSGPRFPDRPAPPAKRPPEDPRKARLKAALKANIARRKAQAAARGTPDTNRKDGPDTD